MNLSPQIRFTHKSWRYEIKKNTRSKETKNTKQTNKQTNEQMALLGLRTSWGSDLRAQFWPFYHIFRWKINNPWMFLVHFDLWSGSVHLAALFTIDVCGWARHRKRDFWFLAVSHRNHTSRSRIVSFFGRRKKFLWQLFEQLFFSRCTPIPLQSSSDKN
jgi:hypothetical protein